jgi:hypothetical protein
MTTDTIDIQKIIDRFFSKRLKRIQAPELTFTREDLMKYNLPIDLDEDYSLKTYFDELEEVHYSVITPEGFELRDDDTVISPEGDIYFYDEKKGLLLGKKPVETELPEIEIPEYKPTQEELDKTIKDIFSNLLTGGVNEITLGREEAAEQGLLLTEDYSLRGYLEEGEVRYEVIGPEPEVDIELARRREDFANMFKRVFPEGFEEMGTGEVIEWVIQNQEEFITNIYAEGRTHQTQALLKLLFPEMDYWDIYEFFLPPDELMRRESINALFRYVPGIVEDGKYVMVEGKETIPEGIQPFRFIEQKFIEQGYTGEQLQRKIQDYREKNQIYSDEAIVEFWKTDLTEESIREWYIKYRGTEPGAYLETLLNYRRGEKTQPWYSTLLDQIGGGIGDLYSSISGALDWMGFEGGFVETIGEYGGKLQSLYPPEEGIGWAVVRNIPNLTALLTTSIIGAGAGTIVASSMGMGRLGTAIVGAIGGTAASRPIESLMEVGGSYDALVAKYGEEEARKRAGNIFWSNMALATTDITEFVVALSPLPGSIVNIAKSSALMRTVMIAGKVSIVGLTEAGEEAVQDVFQKINMGEEIAWDEEMQAAVTVGFVMGAGLGLAGDVVSSITDKTRGKLPQDEQARLDELIERGIKDGLSREIAETQALEVIAGESETGAMVVAESINEVSSEKTKSNIPSDEQISRAKEELDELLSTEESKDISEVIDTTGWSTGKYEPISIEKFKQLTGQEPSAKMLTSDLNKVKSSEAIKILAEEQGITPNEYRQLINNVYNAKVKSEAIEVREESRIVKTEVQIDKRINEVEKLLKIKGRLPKGEGTKSELRLELARLTAERNVKGLNQERIESAIAEIQEEIGNRSMPYHGGAKAGPYKGWTTKQLDEMLSVYEKAGAEQYASNSYTEIQKVREKYRGKIESQANIRQQLYDVASKAPLRVRGKMLAAMKNVKTEAQLEEAINRINRYAEEELSRKLRADIRKLINRTKTKKVRGIIKGKYTAEVQERLDAISNNIEGDRFEAQQKIAQNLKEYEDGNLSPIQMQEANDLLNMTGIENMSVEELQDTYENIKSLIDYGRTVRQEKREQRKASLDKIREDVSGVITGGRGLKPGTGTLSSRELAANKGWLDKLVNAQYGWSELLDKMSRFFKSKPFQSPLSIFGQDTVSRAKNRENEGLNDSYNTILDNFRLIFGTRNKGQINQLLNRFSKEKIDLGTFKNTDGVSINLVLTKDQIISKYQQLKDPSLDTTFREGMKWTDEMMDAVRNNLHPKERAWADWIMSFYNQYYDSINRVYREIYGVNMSHNPFYTPIRRDFESGISESLLTYQDIALYATVTNGSLKARTENIKPLKFNGAAELLINHVNQMEHFKAWAEGMHDLRSVMQHREVKTATIQYHGQDVYRRISDYLNDFARGGIEKQKINRGADWLRRNFTLAVLGIKPAIALKQVPSVVAYMTEMPVTDFVAGVTDFWMNPIGHYRFMMERSPYLKERFGKGFERDIKFAMERGGIDKLTGKGKLRDWFMTLIRLGDKLAVTQGMWSKYLSERRLGKTEEAAMLAAEQSTDRTQPSFSLDSLSAWQRGGSFMKLLTMFQNQPNKYFRIISNNIRNFQYGRGSRVKAASNIFLAWVVAPALFQFIADAFQFRPERQARAWVLGPINWLLVGGQFAQSIYNWVATDEKFDYDASPVLQAPQDILNLVSKAKRMIEDGLDPYENVTIDDWVSFLEYFAKTGGEVLGYPTPWLVQVESGIREGDPRQIIFSKWSLQEPENKQQEDSEEVRKLGLIKVVEEGEEADLSKYIPEVYTMEELYKYFKNRYEQVYFQDIIDEKDSTPEAKAWAEMMINSAGYFILPNVPLYKINTDQDADDTIIQYYIQWQARQKIDNLADIKEFDSLYPKAYLGNVTRRQYELLVKYLESDNKAQFLEENPELKFNLRNQWLIEHPKENAQLALWGQAKIVSMEAYNEFKKLLDEMDIPDSAIPEQTLPPEGSIENYFTYQEMVAEGKTNSWEVQLLLLDDNDLREFLGRQEIETPREILELKIKHRDLYDLQSAYSDPDSTDYIEDDEERKEAIDKLKEDNPEWVDDMRRITALENDGADFAELWVERGNLLDEFTAGSSEAKLWLIDHPEVHQWALKNELLTDDGSGWNIEVMRINVQYREQDDEYDSLPTDDDSRQRYLQENSEYRLARRRRDALTSNGPEGEKFTTEQIDKYVEYYELTSKGYRRERYLIENSDFAQALHDIIGIDLPDPSKVPDEAYDDIYDKFSQQFDRIEGLSDNKSEYYVEDPEERKRIRESLRYKESGSFTRFGLAEIRREAYGIFVPEEFIDRYVEYYQLIGEGKPEWWPDEISWHEDDWWLQDHPAFYREIYLEHLGLKERDFKNTPDEEYKNLYTEEVMNLYREWQGLRLRTDRANFELAHPELDMLLHLEFGTKLEEGPSTKSKQEQILEELFEKWKTITPR